MRAQNEKGAPAVVTHGNPERTTTTVIDPSPLAQAKIELLSDEIHHNVSALQATLDVAIAAYLSSDSTCLIYGLRRAKAYWRAISGSAAELVAADAERLSALRKEGAGQ